MNALLDFMVDSLAFGATFMYGSTGEILTEKAGHLNLGIPGIMCMGGAGGCIVLSLVGGTSLPPFLIVLCGLLGGFIMGAFMGLIYSFLTITLRANQNVTGLALTTFGVGLMKTLMRNKKLVVLEHYLLTPSKYYRFPFAAHTDSLQRLGVMFFLAVIIAILSSYVLYHTKVGLNLRSVGENPGTADAAGINVSKYKYLATCIGSGISGLGGLYYIIDYMVSEEAYLSIEAYGWLSIALVIFVLWKPNMTIVGSFLFGILYRCSNYITKIPGFKIVIGGKKLFSLPTIQLPNTVNPLLKMLPYIFTIVVLVISSIRNKRENQPPASLGLSYFREDR